MEIATLTLQPIADSANLRGNLEGVEIREKETFEPVRSTVNDSFEQGANNAVEKIIEKVDDVTGFGEKIREFGNDKADQYTDFLIGLADKLKGGATEKASKNLKDSKISGFLQKGKDWLGKGNNLFYAVGGLIVIWFLRK